LVNGICILMTLASDLSKSRHESSSSRLNFFSKRLWAWLLVPYVCPYQTCALHIQRLSKVLENFPTHRFPVPTFWVWVVVFLHPWKGGFYNGFDLRPAPKVLGGFWEIVIWPNTWSDLLGNPPQATMAMKSGEAISPQSCRKSHGIDKLPIAQLGS